MVTTVGRFVNAAPYASDYTFEHIYYRSLRSRDEDYLATRDYLWRWDTDWFWCSGNLYAQYRSSAGCSAGAGSIRSSTQR